MAKKNSFSDTFDDIKRLSGSKRERATKLAEKAQFMDAELTKLQEILSEKGWVETYSNGATQSGLKKSSESEAYNTLMKNYLAAMKQLNEMLASEPGDADDLMDFLKND